MFDAFTGWTTDPLAIVADKAYTSNRIRRQIADEGALAVIPSKSNARKPVAHDQNLYAMRNIVERFFNKLKHFRAIATRYEKDPENYLAGIKLVSARIWIRFNESVT